MPGAARATHKDGTSRNRIDAYIGRLKENPLIAILIVIGISVIAVAQFTDAVQKLSNLLPSSEEQLPDLTVCKVDMANSRIDVCNFGRVPAPTNRLYLAWSEGWYRKPHWNNSVLVGALPYVENQSIQPGTKLPVRILQVDEADEGTEFMIDAAGAIEELDEGNNCVDMAGKVIPCRFSGLANDNPN